MKTLQQKRALFALQKVKERKTEFKNKEDLQKYRSSLLNLPAMITTNGLIPTIAFYMKDDVRKRIVEDIIAELKDEEEIKNPPDISQFLENLVKIDTKELRMITKQVLSFAEWLKRMAEVEIETGE